MRISTRPSNILYRSPVNVRHRARPFPGHMYSAKSPVMQIISRSTVGALKISIFSFFALVSVPLGLRFILAFFDRHSTPLQYEHFLALQSQGKIVHPVQVSGNEIFGQMINDQGDVIHFHTLHLAPDFLKLLSDHHILWEPVSSGALSNFLGLIVIFCAHLFLPLTFFTLLKNHRLRLCLEYWAAFEDLARQRTQTPLSPALPITKVLERLADDPHTQKAFLQHKHLIESLRRIAGANEKSMRSKSLLSGIPTISFLEKFEAATNDIFFPKPLIEALPSHVRPVSFFNDQAIMLSTLESFWKNHLIPQHYFVGRKKDGALAFVNIPGLVRWMEDNQRNGVVTLSTISVAEMVETYTNPSNIVFWSSSTTIVDLELFQKTNPAISRPLIVVVTHDGSEFGNPENIILL